MEGSHTYYNKSKFYPLTNCSQNHIQFCSISITLNNIPIVVIAVYSSHCPQTHINQQ